MTFLAEKSYKLQNIPGDNQCLLHSMKELTVVTMCQPFSCVSNTLCIKIIDNDQIHQVFPMEENNIFSNLKIYITTVTTHNDDMILNALYTGYDFNIRLQMKSSHYYKSFFVTSKCWVN